MAKERSLTRIFFKNLWNSLRPRRIWGIRVGTDYNGTEYYEIPLTESSTRRRPPRWFTPRRQDDFEQEIPPEWEAWLRYRRDDPPTEEEIERNLQKVMITKRNAEKLEMEKPEALRAEPPRLSTTSKDFPIYEDMEGMPGGLIRGRRGKNQNNE